MSEKQETPQPQLTFTSAQLKELMLEMAKELRRPADKTPEEAAAIETDKKMRMDAALAIKQQMDNKKAQQKACRHIRANGSTCAVHVASMGLMICQHCHALILPENANPEAGGYGPVGGIYDNDLFNKLMQLEQELGSGMAQ